MTTWSESFQHRYKGTGLDVWLGLLFFHNTPLDYKVLIYIIIQIVVVHFFHVNKKGIRPKEHILHPTFIKSDLACYTAPSSLTGASSCVSTVAQKAQHKYQTTTSSPLLSRHVPTYESVTLLDTNKRNEWVRRGQWRVAAKCGSSHDPSVFHVVQCVTLFVYSPGWRFSQSASVSPLSDVNLIPHSIITSISCHARMPQPIRKCLYCKWPLAALLDTRPSSKSLYLAVRKG